MCCGNQRQEISARSPRANVPVPEKRAVSTPATPSAPAVSQARTGAVFEYAGDSALTVVSPVTKKVYRFERPGARIAADPRDTPWLTFVPQLRRGM